MYGIQYPEDFRPIGAGEMVMLEAVDDLRRRRADILIAAPPAHACLISATFLRWFLLEAIAAAETPVFRFELHNCTVKGLLNLSRAFLAVTLCFRRCHFPDGVDLTETQAGSFEMIGGSAAFIHANRMLAEGSVVLGAPVGTEGRFTIERDLRLTGAQIRGNLDLRRCRLGRANTPGRNTLAMRADGLAVDGTALLSGGFRATGQVSLNGARIARNLNCSGAVLRNPGGYSLSAAGAHIAGSLYTRTGFRSHGAFRLEGTRIIGDWKAGAAHFMAAASRKPGWKRTDGNSLELRAIIANGLTVLASVMLDDGCRVQGTVDLLNAKIGSDFKCNSAIFDFPGEEMLYADGISISGAFFLGEARVNGLLRLVQATIGQGLFANGTTFDLTGRFEDRLGELSVSAEEIGLNICGIFAPASKLSGSFYWRRIRKIPDPTGHRRLLLSILDSKAEAVEDDRESWDLLDQIDVRNCRYETIADLTGDTMWRADLLDRAYAPLNYGRGFRLRSDQTKDRSVIWSKVEPFCRSLEMLWLGRRGMGSRERLEYAIMTFAPQPYIQLARVVRRAGYEAAANDIIVRMERNRTRYSGFGRWRQLGRWVTDGLVRHGFSPLRPVWLLLIWTAISAVFFEYGFANRRIVPTHENLEHYSERDWKPGNERYEFNPVIYALDTLVPLIDLNQKKNWHVEPLPSQPDKAASIELEMQLHVSVLTAVGRLLDSLPNEPLGWLVLFNTFFGWVLTTFLAAGVTGVLRSSAPDTRDTAGDGG
jgi:hypothetical protein